MASSRHLRTQTALSKRSGVTASTIGRILRGEVDAQATKLERLAHAFDMSYSALASLAEGDELGDGIAGTLQPGKYPDVCLCFP